MARQTSNKIIKLQTYDRLCKNILSINCKEKADGENSYSVSNAKHCFLTDDSNKYCLQLSPISICNFDQLVGHHWTRTTFETPKYPRRPRDQYTAQIVNTLELSAPPRSRGKKIKQNKTLFNLVISLVKFQTTNTYVAAKNCRSVKQSLC